MMIGIIAITLLFAVGAGAKKAYQQALESMGKNLLSVSSRRKPGDAIRGSRQRYQTLTLSDWRAILDEIDGVEQAAPIAMNSFELRYAGESVKRTVIGTTPGFQLTNNQVLAAGRFMDEFDLLDNRRVAVIGSQVEKELFHGGQAVGERLQVGGAPFIVIGVLQAKGVDITGSPQDDRILVPVTTALRRLLNVDYIDRIFLQAVSKPLINSTILEVGELLRSRHGLSSADADDFIVRDQASMVSTMDKTSKSLSRFLAAIAVLTLGLSSAGLLGVSLLSVRERRGEIGLRIAVGARPQQVMVQFLSESVMIALIGTAAGLLAAVFGIIVGAWLLGWQMEITAKGLLYAFLIPLLLSVLSGAYPALRAARLNPVIALQGS
jgi:putative ABC transport system permease protein